MATDRIHKPLLIIALAGAAMAFGGTLDYREALDAEQRYCERVEDRVHTDYKGICDVQD